MSKKTHAITVTLMVFSALGLAISVPNVAIVVGFLGTISNPIICFFIPCVYYIKCFPGHWTRRDLLLAWIVLILMFIISVMSLVLFLLGLAGVF